jgi:hypothetical protein
LAGFRGQIRSTHITLERLNFPKDLVKKLEVVMGGWGSGRYGFGSSAATNEVNRVDIRYLRKRGWLYPGARGSLSWSCGGEPAGNVCYSITGDAFTLDYKVRQCGGDWEPITLHVPMTTTPCRYGGQRYYFQCRGLGCGRRCEVLYSAGKYFVCRKCAGLLYSSQKGCPIDRAIAAKHKLGKQIFEDYDGDGWRKKKGMHWKTFDRLYARYQSYDRRAVFGLAGRFGWAELENYGLSAEE